MTKNNLLKILFAVLILPITATYQLSFLGQQNPYLQIIVIGLSLFIFCLSWYRWMFAVYFFIFSIPLFNTLPKILNLPWPYFNLNATFTAALITSWICHYIWKKPIAEKNPDIFVLKTPFDLIAFAFVVILTIALPVGWARFNNIFCAGFYFDATQNLKNIPFYSLLDNYLCFTRFWQFTQIGLTFYLLASSIRTKKQIRNIFWIILFSSVIVSCYGLFQYFANFQWVGINWYFKRINATFNGPHAAGMYFTTVSVISLALFIATKIIWRKILIFIALALNVVGAWYTGTKTAIFAYFIVIFLFSFGFLVVALAKYKEVRRAAFYVFISILLLGPGLTIVLHQNSPLAVIQKTPQYKRLAEGFSDFKFNKSFLNKFVSYRFYHWSTARNVIKKHHFIGTGLGTFDKLYRYNKLKDDTYKVSYTHSLYLDVLAELGILALILLVFLYFIPIILSWKLFVSRNISWRWRIVHLAFVIIFSSLFLANFFTSDLYYVMEIQLWISLLAVLVIKNYQLSFRIDPASITSYWKNSFSTFFDSKSKKIFGAALALIVIIFAGYLNLKSAFQGQNFFQTAQKYSYIDNILEYGIYYYEKDKNNNKFARTAKRVYRPIIVKDRFMRIFLRADHPDTVKNPVRTKVFLDNIEVANLVLSNRFWTLTNLDLNNWTSKHSTNTILKSGIRAVLKIESDRTWNPYKSKRGNKNLQYGVDLGAIEWGYY